MKFKTYAVISLLLILSTPSFAANKTFPARKQLSIDLNLSINNKTVQKSKIVTKFGQSASVTQLVDTKTGSQIEVMPSYNANNELVMQFKIAKIVDNEKRLVSKPIIVTQLGQRAELTVNDVDKNIITLAFSTDDNNFA